ncbi:hypothetical protein ACHEVM_12005 [Roseomonas sp. SXEYE002]
MRGRTEIPGSGASWLRAREWVGYDDAGETIARVVRVHGPFITDWRLFHAVALDDEARVVELCPSLPGDRWLVVVNDRVVDRAPLALTAVRRAEEALASG